MSTEVADLIKTSNSIVVIQAENPDADSLGSSLALEEILSELGKNVTMYCPVDIPKHTRYINGWDRVTAELDTKADLAIIVDTAADVLLTKVFDVPGARHFLETQPVIVIDHHTTAPTLSFPYTLLATDAVATSEIIFTLAQELGWPISAAAAENLMIALMSDSLGLTTPNVTPQSFHIAGALTELGASTAVIEGRRRELMKKSPEILAYKGQLINRIEYFLDGKLALVHIPWEDIQAYSDQYNPSVLVLDEMRLVEGVEVAVAIKTYPDGKVTGKLRSNLPVAETVAGYFGGGGHAHAAGFRAYEKYDTIISELLTATQKALSSYDTHTT